MSKPVEYKNAVAVCYSPGRFGWMIHREYDTQQEAEAEIERLKPLYPSHDFWTKEYQVKPYRPGGWWVQELDGAQQ